METKNVSELCSGLKEEKVVELYNVLEKEGVIKHFAELIKDGEEDDELVKLLCNTLNEITDDYPLLYIFLDYIMTDLELPIYMAREKLSEAIILDIMSVVCQY